MKIVNQKESDNHDTGAGTGLLNRFTALLAIAFSFFHLYIAGIGIMSMSAARHIHLILSMVLIFLIYPLSKKKPRSWTFYFDLILAALAVSVGLYLELQVEALEWRAGEPNTADLIFGLTAILLTLEITRRAVGFPLVVTAGLFILYAYFGNLIPGYFGHRGYDLEMLVTAFYIEMRGIYGTSLGVVVQFVVLFVVFGAFLQKSGGGDFLVKFAYALTGRMRGGPAKTAVISSALMGSISGSATANVVTTGSFTIPIMKKMGYPAHVAAGVEVASSVGGVLMPPIMGAAAFLIVALTGIPYGEVIRASVIPSLMYFVSVYSAVHFMACKLGLKGIASEGDYWRNLFTVLISGIRFLFPLAFLFVLLIIGYTPTYSAFAAILSLILLSAIRRENRLGLKEIFAALELGGRNSLTVSAACACVGIIVGVVALTGVGVKFSSYIATGSGGNIFIAVLFVGMASLVLGIELPITASYLVLAILAAPALHKLGVPLLISHLIVLWFSIDAAVTPPVCITSFVASGVAKSDPFKTAIAAWRIAKGLYIIPFLMAYTPICLNGTFSQILIAVLTGTVGLISLSAAWQGWLLYQTPTLQRILLGVVTVTSLKPGIVTDVIGLGLFFGILVFQYFSNQATSKKFVSKIPSQSE
jgi:TRAP transporter 4TM/12TM fusion protein